MTALLKSHVNLQLSVPIKILSVINLSIIFELHVLLGTCSFIYQGTLTRRQRSHLFGLRVKLPPVTTSLIAQR